MSYLPSSMPRRPKALRLRELAAGYCDPRRFARILPRPVDLKHRPADAMLAWHRLQQPRPLSGKGASDQYSASHPAAPSAGQQKEGRSGCG